MSKEPSKKKIGVFVTTGFLLLFGAVILLTGPKFFKRIEHQVLYFDGSVGGLNIGSQVVFKGVPIGKVEQIRLMADVDAADFSIPVYIAIDPEKIQSGAHKKLNKKEGRKLLNEMIEKGLRARLTVQSIITGQMMIELDMMPGTHASFKGNQDDDIVEIPTVASSFQELSQRLEQMPIRETLEGIKTLLDTVNAGAPGVLKNVNKITADMGTLLGYWTGPDSAAMTQDIIRMVNDLSAAAQAFKNFADYLERHPEALLKGKGDYD